MSAGFRSALIILGVSAAPPPSIARPSSPVGATILFLVADVNGRVLTALRPAVHRASWRENAVGAMTFTLARSDPKLVEEYFTFGNRVLLQFDNGLPDWGGVLTGAREWTGSAVTFEAYSGEWLLVKRRTARSRYFSGATVGAILTALLNEANAVYPTGLRLGDVWGGGQGHSPEYFRKSLFDVLAESLVRNLSAGAFDVTPRLEGGFVNFYVNLYQRKGSDKPGVALVEGRNVSAARYREMDEVVNVWHMAGDGDGWAADSRVYATVMNSESVARHGMREDAEVRSGVVYQATLDETAANRLAETEWPTRALGLTVDNCSPGRYRDYEVGDAVSCRLFSYGFHGVDGMFTVRAREFFPDEGTADLVLTEGN